MDSGCIEKSIHLSHLSILSTWTFIQLNHCPPYLLACRFCIMLTEKYDTESISFLQVAGKNKHFTKTKLTNSFSIQWQKLQQKIF